MSTNSSSGKRHVHEDQQPNDDIDVVINGKRRKIPVLRRKLRNKMDRTNDVIHSSIEICPVMKAMLDSPPMQRLRKVQQLATAEHVYVNCTHSRLEHSLGVAHLAERLCRRIQQRQPVLQGTAKDVLCVKLAGLMHDLGHGPFSHTFEDFLHQMPTYLEQHPDLKQFYTGVPDMPDNCKHEIMSLMLIDAILESKGLRINLHKLDEPLETVETEFTTDPIDQTSLRVFDTTTLANATSTTNNDNDAYSLILTSRDFVFIKECIWGGPVPAVAEAIPSLPKGCFVGRPQAHEEWLYDIVSNRHSGCDVDKIDYTARDHRSAFKGSGEIDKVMVEEAIVAWGACTNPQRCARCNSTMPHPRPGKHLMICYPDKVVSSAMNFFKTRHRLHKLIYRHKKTDAVGYMICDILKAADPYFRIVLPPEEVQADMSSHSSYCAELPISRAMCHVRAFLRLNDSVIDMIANTRDERLKTARQLIRRLQRGDLYKCVAVHRINLANNPAHRKLLGLPEEPSLDDQQIIQERMLAIGKEMVQAKHIHDYGRLTLTHDDLIVEWCSIHCGCGPVNPLSRMRFLQKHQMKALDSHAVISLEDIPEAHVPDEAQYEADIPRVFEETSIRLFCRDPEKCELAEHVFEQWLVHNYQQQQTNSALATQPPTTPPRQPGNTEGVTPSPATARQVAKGERFGWDE